MTDYKAFESRHIKERVANITSQLNDFNKRSLFTSLDNTSLHFSSPDYYNIVQMHNNVIQMYNNVM